MTSDSILCTFTVALNMEGGNTMKTITNIYDDSGWTEAQEYPNGTMQKILHDDQGVRTLLLKLPKNFFMEPHAHITAEQHFVLQGEYTIGGKQFTEGTFQDIAPHEEHGPFASKKGAIILITWYPIAL